MSWWLLPVSLKVLTNSCSLPLPSSCSKMHVIHGAGGFRTTFPGVNAYPPNMLILHLDRDFSFP